MLSTLPVLAESPANRAARARTTRPLLIELRSPGQAPVALKLGADAELIMGAVPAHPDATVPNDAAGRLLALWGRRSPRHETTIDATSTTMARTTAHVLWPPDGDADGSTEI